MKRGRGVAEIDSEAYDGVLSRALPHLQTRHNEIHTHISRGFAEHLLALEGGNPDVVIPAILLHDIGWSQVPEEEQLSAFGPNVEDPELTKVHEREGAEMARNILADLQWPEELAGEVVSIIAGHDTREGSRSIHESAVRDADKLYRFSPQGFELGWANFNLDPTAYLTLLEARIGRWFFTTTGARLAQAESGARWRELKDGALGKV